MAMKTCRYCGIVALNHICPVSKKNKNYNDSKREDKEIYWDKKWKKLREEVLEYQKNICLWSLYVEGTITEANQVHHIITLADDRTLAYDIENVIGLSKDAHDHIHKLYKINKTNTIKLIRECLRLWNNNNGIKFAGTLKHKLNSTPPV